MSRRRGMHASAGALLALVAWAALPAPLAGQAGFAVQVRTQPEGNTLKGRPLQAQPAVALLRPDGTLDVGSAGGVVGASLGVNPTGAKLGGSTTAMLVDGVAAFTDLRVLPGGEGFRLRFTAMSSESTPVEALSDEFGVGGQEARLVIVTQPRVTLEMDERGAVMPVVAVVNELGELLADATPAVTASLDKSPGGGELSASSVATVRAEGGRAAFGELFLTRAATLNEPGATPESGPRGFEEGVTLAFSAPGFRPVVSEQFSVLPLLHVLQEPSSDREVVIEQMCAGPVEGCAETLAGYLPAGDVLRAATLDVDVACTDLDSPGEVVKSVSIGSTTLAPGAFSAGPWPGCAFAGCRGQCATNMRRVLTGYDVAGEIGDVDQRTGIYYSDGRPLSVRLALNGSVNICPCGGNHLQARLTLRVVLSERVQGAPLWRQPQVSLHNDDLTLYEIPTTIFAAIDPAYNPAGAVLTGATEALTEGGVAAFTGLGISQGGDGFRLVFGLRFGARNVSSGALGVGFGHFPRLTLDCSTCTRPRTATGENNKLQPLASLQLQTALAAGPQLQAASSLAVSVRMGVNGPGDGELEGATTVNAVNGKVTFDSLRIFNGNCAKQAPECGGACGGGYSLVFTSNGLWAETDVFTIGGYNRSPRWLPPTPPNGTLMSAVVGVPMQPFTINASDPNDDPVSLVQTPALGGVNLTATAHGAPRGPAPGACPRPLADAALGGAAGASAEVVWTPDCNASHAVFPAEDRVVPLCFRALDTTLLIGSFDERTTASALRCVHVRVASASRPAFVAPFHMDAHGPPAPEALRAAAAYAGCMLRLPVTAEERGLNGSLGSALRVRAFRTTVTSLYSQRTLDAALPDGAELDGGTPGPTTTGTLMWRPRRGDEGHIYSVCFVVESTFGGGCVHTFFAAPWHGHPGQYCVDVTVERCRYCASGGGEGLVDIARDWKTSYLQLWAGNDINPDVLLVDHALHMGPVLSVGSGATLEAIALKHGVTVQMLLDWNPDVASDAAAAVGRRLLSSEGLYESGEAPWAVVNGTRLPDSQEVCVLPNICTAVSAPPPDPTVEALPDGATGGAGGAAGAGGAGGAGGAPLVSTAEPFSCDRCTTTEGLFCAGLRCVEGAGDPPWDEVSCTRQDGTRCERCAVCREEVLDFEGRVVVRGQYRWGGCGGLQDSICEDCTPCGAGEYEVSKCTPLSDRVCARIGSNSESTFLPV